jgi:hypothetical protein
MSQVGLATAALRNMTANNVLCIDVKTEWIACGPRTYLRFSVALLCELYQAVPLTCCRWLQLVEAGTVSMPLASESA